MHGRIEDPDRDTASCLGTGHEVSCKDRTFAAEVLVAMADTTDLPLAS